MIISPVVTISFVVDEISGCDDFSFSRITFLVVKITLRVAVMTSSVVKITFVVAEITFKVAVTTSPVVKIIFLVTEIIM